MKKVLFLASLLLTTLSLFAAVKPDDVVGIWKNSSGKGHVQIFKQNGKYYGKIVWLRDPVDVEGKPKVDKRNLDPLKRSTPLIGLVMLREFSFDDNEWTDGHVYNPQDGKEYKAYMHLKDPNTLVVRGYIGFSWIGKSDTWTRVG